MWDLPGPGLEPVFSALAGGSLTTAPPGKPHFAFLNFGVFPSKLKHLLCACQYCTGSERHNWARQTRLLSSGGADEVLFSPPLLQTYNISLSPCCYDLISITSNGYRIFLQRLNHIHLYLSVVHLDQFQFWWVDIFYFIIYLFIFWLCHAVCGILVSWPEIEPVPLALEAQILNHWTAREVPSWCILKVQWEKNIYRWLGNPD